MSLFNRVLAGLGAGLIEKGKEDFEMQKQQMLLDRETALKQLEFQHDDQTNATNHAARLEEIGATGAEQRRTDMFQGVVQSRIKAQDHAYNQADIILKGNIDLTKDKTIEGMREKGELTRAGYEAALDLQRQLKLAGTTVDHWATTNDGRLMAFNKLGKPLEQTATSGGFSAPATPDEGLGLPGSKPPAPAQPGPASYSNVQANTGIAPAPAAGGGKAAALAQLGNVYAQASQNPDQFRSMYPGMYDPNGNLLPKDTLISKLNQQFGGQ